MDGTKGYRFTVRWGEARNTDDAEGHVTQTSDVRPTRQQIVAVLDRFIGDIEQTPPIFSAIKIDGKRADELARAAGATLAEAARLANEAAGIAVAKFGPAVVTPAELLRALGL